jgi:hypothetical protein
MITDRQKKRKYSEGNRAFATLSKSQMDFPGIGFHGEKLTTEVSFMLRLQQMLP